MARNFANKFWLHLNKSRHQDKPLLIRLRGQWEPVDPTVWDENMDCSVAVALGRGDDMQQMSFLAQIAQKQEQALQMLGADNPLVKPSQLYNTYSQMVRKMGFKNPESFFTPIDAKADAMLAQQSQQAKQNQVDPNVMLAKVELAKAQAETFAKLEAQAIDRAKLQLEEDFKRDNMEADIILKAADMAGKYGMQVDWQQIIGMTNRPRPDIQQLADALIQSEKQASAQILAQIGIQANQAAGQGSQPQQPPMAQQ